MAPFEVYDGTAWEAGLLKSILDDNEIEAIIQQRSSLPWNIIPTTGASLCVFVARKDLEKAQGIVAEFIANMARENSSEESR